MTVSARWPEAREQYLRWHAGQCPAPPFALGEVQLVHVEPDLWLAHLLVQHGIRSNNGAPPIQYGALESALERLASHADQLGASVHMPRIGTGLAGGSWQAVEPLVQERLVQRGVGVFVYRLPRPSART